MSLHSDMLTNKKGFKYWQHMSLSARGKCLCISVISSESQTGECGTRDVELELEVHLQVQVHGSGVSGRVNGAGSIINKLGSESIPFLKGSVYNSSKYRVSMSIFVGSVSLSLLVGIKDDILMIAALV